MKNKLPIGYYLKTVDTLLTEGIDNIHQESGITRMDWQLLHSINENKHSVIQPITKLLSAFANKETLENALNNLCEKGYITKGNELTLTDNGKIFYEHCLQKQIQFRKKAMQNISEDEYEKTLSCLEKIIENLSPKSSS